MLLTAIYFILALLVIMAIGYGVLQALQFFGVNVPVAVRNIIGVLIFLVFLYWFLTTFHIMPGFLGYVTVSYT